MSARCYKRHQSLLIGAQILLMVAVTVCGSAQVPNGAGTVAAPATQGPPPPAVPPQANQVPSPPVLPQQVANLIATLVLWPAWAGPFAGNKPITFHWTLTNTTPISLAGKFAVKIDGSAASIAGLPLVQSLSPAAVQEGDFTIPSLEEGHHNIELLFFPLANNVKAEVGKGEKARVPLVQAAMDITVTPPFIDADSNTLDDHFEHALLEHYRPYFKFSKPGLPERALLEPDWDPYPPIDAAEYLRHSRAGWEHAAWTQNDVLLQPDVFKNDQFDRLLELNITSDDTCTDNMHNCGSDMTVNNRRTQYAIDAVDLPDAHTAMDRMQSVGNIGLYGHVVPYQRFIKIEYWQFFPQNGGNFPHGGDWTTVQLLIDMDNNLPCQNPTAFGQIASVFHYHHGDESRFDFFQCTFAGRTQESDVFQFFVAAGGQNVQMFREAGGAFSHPVTYIEYATHEFWPTSEGSAAATPNHDGDGASFLTSTPPNLGEVEAPLSEYPQAKIMMRFNGYWGACCVETSRHQDRRCTPNGLGPQAVRSAGRSRAKRIERTDNAKELSTRLSPLWQETAYSDSNTPLAGGMDYVFENE